MNFVSLWHHLYNLPLGVSSRLVMLIKLEILNMQAGTTRYQSFVRDQNVHAKVTVSSLGVLPRADIMASVREAAG